MPAKSGLVHLLQDLCKVNAGPCSELLQVIGTKALCSVSLQTYFDHIPVKLKEALS